MNVLSEVNIKQSLAALNKANNQASYPPFLRHQTDWSLSEGKVCKHYTFSNFETAFRYMTQVALLAEAHNHHPEWFNVYSKLDVALVTHDAGGITEKDFALAKSMDEALQATPV